MRSELYLRVREKEGRLYTDDVVARLPFIHADHPLADEWRARAVSASRLTRYLSRQHKSLSILDLGCGNGWLSNTLAKAGHRVVGMDQNTRELEQAARVFSATRGLLFLQADIFSGAFPLESFDAIILASVIQYFHDLPTLIVLLKSYLKPFGAIHIIDSPLYSPDQVADAVRRSGDYYAALGIPEMAQHYFHHRITDLKSFSPVMFHAPSPLTLRLKRWLGWVDSPFPWILIRK